MLQYRQTSLILQLDEVLSAFIAAFVVTSQLGFHQSALGTPLMTPTSCLPFGLCLLLVPARSCVVDGHFGRQEPSAHH